MNDNLTTLAVAAAAALGAVFAVFAVASVWWLAPAVIAFTVAAGIDYARPMPGRAPLGCETCLWADQCCRRSR